MAFELHSSYACRAILNVQWLGLSVNIHNLQVLQMPRLLCSLVGCTALPWLQPVMHVSGLANPDSVVEVLLLRLDEQGPRISRPWA